MLTFIHRTVTDAFYELDPRTDLTEDLTMIQKNPRPALMRSRGRGKFHWNILLLNISDKFTKDTVIQALSEVNDR